MNMQASPHQLRIAYSLCQVYCSKHCPMASGNSGLIQPYMFEPETVSEEEKGKVRVIHVYKLIIRMVMPLMYGSLHVKINY